MTARASRRSIVLGALGITLVILALVCASVGAVRVPLGVVLHAIANPAEIPAQQASVLFAIRFPRVVLAVLVGSGLGVSGAAMQGVFRNPLVDPGLLGVSTGAGFGAALAIVLADRLVRAGLPSFLSGWLVSLFAFGGGLVAATIAERVARVDGRTSIATLLLAGIAVNGLAGALTGALLWFADDAQLRTIVFWTFGSLGGATWRSIAVCAPFVVLPALLLPRSARALNALLLGDSDAGYLGHDVERVRRLVVVAVALVVGAAVAATGVVGFVGLVVPHLVRLWAGPDHRVVLPGAALLGAILLLASDLIARTVVVPAELPLGVVTAALGTPFFLALLLRERRRIA
ncbi:MAG TPA: iron ABC transporter permease [Polyangiaceae bacterium]